MTPHLPKKEKENNQGKDRHKRIIDLFNPNFMRYNNIRHLFSLVKLQKL